MVRSFLLYPLVGHSDYPPLSALFVPKTMGVMSRPPDGRGEARLSHCGHMSNQGGIIVVNKGKYPTRCDAAQMSPLVFTPLSNK